MKYQEAFDAVMDVLYQDVTNEQKARDLVRLQEAAVAQAEVAVRQEIVHGRARIGPG